MNLPLDPDMTELILQQTRDGVLIVDTRTPRITHCNPAFVKLSGYSREFLIGLSLERLIEPPEILNHLSDNPPHPTRLRCHDERQVEITIQLHTLKDTRLLFVRENEQPKVALCPPLVDGFSRQFLSNIQEGIIYYDHELRYRFWNRFMEELTGYIEKEVLGLQPWVLFPFLAEQGLQTNLTRALNGERVAIADIYVDYPRTGIKGWVSANYSPVYGPDQSVVGVLTTLRDHTDQLLSAEAVRKNEERYRALIENTSEGTNILSPTGEVLYQSPVGPRLLGYIVEELSGRNALTHIHPDDLPRMKLKLKEVVENPQTIFDVSTRLLRKDGSLLWMEGKAYNLIENPAIGGIVLNWRDVTRRRLAEEQLQKEQQFLTTIIQTAAEGICVCAGRSEHPYVRFQIWNNQMEKITGYTLQEMNELGWYQSMYPNPEHRQLAIERMERMYKGDDLYGEVWPITRKDGEIRTLMISTSGVQIDNGEVVTVALMQDISVQNQAQRELRDSQQMLRLILDSIPQGVFWKDQNSKYLGCNRVVANAFGLPSDESIIGKDDYQLPGLTKAQAEFFIQKDREVLSRNEPQTGILEQATLADNSTIWMETNKIPIRNENKEIVGILGTWQNVTERQKAADALRDSEERYRAFVAQSTEGIWRCQLETPISASLPTLEQIEHFYNYGFMAECNDAFARMYGFEKASEVIGVRLDQLLVRDDPKNIAYLTAFIESGYHLSDAESHELDRYGKPRIFVNSLVGAVRDGLLHYAWGMQRDITERKKAEEIIRASEQKLSAIASTMPQGLYVYDLTTNQTVFSNRELWRDLGYSEEEGARFGQHFMRAMLHPDDLANLPKLFDRWESVQDGEILETEYRIRNVKGEWRWFQGRDTVYQRDSSGKVTQFIGTAQDITERKQAEAVIRRSEANLAEAQKLGLIGSWDLDLVTNEVYWSEQQYLQVGMSPNTPIPTLAEFISLIHPDDRERIEEDIRHCFATGNPVDHEFRLCLTNGQTRWIHGLGTVQFNDLAQPIKFFGLSQDITERKRAEAEQRKLEVQLQQTQKLESLGILAGGIAHDFNNLLTSILGYADLALDELPEGVSTRDFIEEMVNGAHQAAELTKQMLAYSGKGRFKVEALNLSTLVEGLSRLLQISISKKCSIRSQLDPNLPAIEGDAPQIRQIIMNLVINASEAIGDNTGLIGVTTGVQHCTQKDLAEYPLNEHLPEGDYVFLEVADAGSGMSAETLSKIFDPFFTTKFTGRGLGLSAVLGIVRGHKGAIKCTSELGKGTTFKVIFPVSALEYATTGKANSPVDQWRATGVALVVDDEVSVRNLAKTMLEKMGFQVLLAQDGHEGVEIYRNNLSQIRLVLLDLTMPKLDGEQTFREMRSIHSATPIILSSGYSESINQERFANFGFAGFIQKPFRYEELREVIQKALFGSSDVKQSS